MFNWFKKEIIQPERHKFFISGGAYNVRIVDVSSQYYKDRPTKTYYSVDKRDSYRVDGKDVDEVFNTVSKRLYWADLEDYRINKFDNFVVIKCRSNFYEQGKITIHRSRYIIVRRFVEDLYVDLDYYLVANKWLVNDKMNIVKGL